MTTPVGRAPTHPGEVFEEEWRKPIGISQAEAARRMKMSANRLNEVILGRRAVSPETAVLFGKLTDTSAEMWARMQADYDVWHARKKLRVNVKCIFALR